MNISYLYINDFGMIGFDQRVPGLLDLKSFLADTFTVETEVDDLKLNVEFLKEKDLIGLRHVYDDIFIGDSCVYDAKNRALIRQLEDRIVIKTDRNNVEWIIWLIQCSLLMRNKTFIHCASIEKNGEVYLFPSWGGVGKTALVKGFVEHHEWKLLGDDLIICDNLGGVSSFLKNMVLYPYHKETFPEVFGIGGGPVAPIWMTNILSPVNRFIKKIVKPFPRLLEYARSVNPQSKRVPPSKVFTEDQLGRSGRVKAIFWLERVKGIDKATISTKNLDISSRILGSTINEFDPRCIRVTNAGMGAGALAANEVYSNWMDILSQLESSDIATSKIDLPLDLDVSRVPEEVYQLIKTLS